MSDDTKVWLTIFAILGLMGLSFVGLIYLDMSYKMELKRIACEVPDSIACALAVR